MYRSAHMYSYAHMYVHLHIYIQTHNMHDTQVYINVWCIHSYWLCWHSYDIIRLKHLKIMNVPIYS